MHNRISVVIPAYNEEKLIGQTIHRVIDVMNELKINFEIIVSNNNSSDKTQDIAEKLGCRVIYQPERNISKTRNAGASIATSDLLLFIDADTKITSKLLKSALEHINKGYALVGAISTFDKYNTWVSYGVWFYNLISYIFRLGTGQFLLIRKKDFIQLGGFSENQFAFEDIELARLSHRKFGFKKHKVLFIPVTTSGRKFSKEKDQFTFLFQLLGVLLNKPIGKTKQNLEFWYGKQQNVDKPYKKYILAIIALMLFFENTFGSSLGPINDFKNISTFFLFLGMVSLLFDLKPFLIISISTLLVELIGESTGFPFGLYKYSEYYSQIGIVGVPLFIPLAWYLLITANTRLFGHPIKTAVSIVFIDIFLERFAETNNIWNWFETFIITAPIQNYISWFLLSLVFYRYINPQKISLFYSTAVLMLLTSYIGVNLMKNSAEWGIILVIYSFVIFGIYVNKKINSFL